MKDYKQQSNGDIDLSLGDLTVIESTEQHQRDLLLSAKGHIRDKAEVGVGIVNYLYDNDSEGLLRATRKELTADGMKVKKVSFVFPTDDMEIEAAYEND